MLTLRKKDDQWTIEGGYAIDKKTSAHVPLTLEFATLEESLRYLMKMGSPFVFTTEEHTAIVNPHFGGIVVRNPA